MIGSTLTQLRERLIEVEDRLAVARRARAASPALVATLIADAAALREQIAVRTRQRFQRGAS